MKRLLLLITAASALWAQPSVSNIRVTDVSHSTMRLTWDSSAPVAIDRVCYGTSPGVYSFCLPASGNGLQSVNIQFTLAGLNAGTTYYLCPQSSFDGVTWSPCVATIQATLPDPAIHPAMPTVPTSISLAMPNMTGATVVTVASDCSDLAAKMVTAEAAHATGPAVLVVPSNPSTCVTDDFFLPGSSLAKYYLPGNITLPSTIGYTAHGFSNGDLIWFGGDQLFGPGPTGLDNFTNYYVCNGTANTFQVGTNPGCTTIVNLGTTGSGHQCVVDTALPSEAYWLLVVPEWPLGTTFKAPDGIRLDPAWAGNLARFQMTALGNSHFGIAAQECLHNWRFKGTELTTAVTPEDPRTTTDPVSYGTIARIFTRGFIVDQSLWHGQGYPSRTWQGTFWQGGGNAIYHSVFNNMDFWRAAAKTGLDLVPSVTSPSVVNVSAGSYNEGAQTCTTSGLTVTITGGAPTSHAVGFFDMNCVPTVIGPTGLVVNCTVVGGGTCAYSTSGAPTFPVNGSGSTAAGRFFDVAVNAGAWGSVLNDFKPSQGNSSVYGGEGPTGISLLCGGGRGPMMVVGSEIESGNIGFHSEDSCNSPDLANPGTDITLRRNLFHYRNSWRPQDPTYDKHLRIVRNMVEFKQGRRILIDGNIFEGQWASLTPQAYALTFLPTKGNGVVSPSGVLGTGEQDILVSNNIFRNNDSGMQVVGGLINGGGMVPAMLRARVVNNSVGTVAGQFDPVMNSGATVCGFGFFNWGPIEDETVIHNTWALDGQCPMFYYQIASPIEGMKLDNNIFGPINDVAGRLGAGLEFDDTSSPNVPAPVGTAGRPILDWVGTAGPGNPNYTFAKNLLLVGPSGSALNWFNAWNGLPSTVECTPTCSTSTFASREANIQFNNPGSGDYTLAPTSPYHNTATDGTDPGIDQAALNNAVGIVGTPVVTGISNTTATITWTVPDAFPCRVDYTSGNILTSWSSATPSGTFPTQTVTLTFSASPGPVTYNFRIDCEIFQPVGSLVTLSGGGVANPSIVGNSSQLGSTRVN